MRFFLFLGLIITWTACNKTPSNLFTLEGFVEGAADSKNMVLSYFSLKNGEFQDISDTAKIINGKFFFEGTIEDLTAAELYFDDINVLISVRIYLEPTPMKLQINKNKPYTYQLSGTKVEKENIELRKALEPYEKISHKNLKYADSILGQIQLHGDNTLVRDSLMNHLKHYFVEHAVGEKKSETTLDFVLKYNTYRIVPDLLYLLAKSKSVSVDTIKSIYNNLPQQSKTGTLGKLAYKQIEYWESEKDTSVGNTAPDFTRKDFSGKTIKLSDFKNKQLVLLDFWASWCGPCLKGIPKIKDLHDKYGEKGLTIISISLDKDSDKWLNAINNYQLSVWTQILNAENKNKAVFNTEDIALLYNVEFIPHFILIDRQGKIIANGPGEEQLNKMDSLLQSVFSNRLGRLL